MSSRPPRWIVAAVVLAALLVAAGIFWLARPRVDATKGREADVHSSPSAAASASPTPSFVDPSDLRRSLAADLAEAFRERNPGTRSARFGRLMREWFEQDPEGALAYLQAMPRESEYTAGLLIVIGGIARTEPERALLLASTMATRREDWILYNAVFDELGRTDIDRALKCLALVPPGEPRLNSTRALAEEWMARDSPAAWAWAQTPADPAERSAAIEAALAILARTKPEASAQLAQRFLIGDARDRALAVSLHRLTADDPSAAARVVDKLAPGPAQTAAALEVARALAVEQPEAALAWLQGLPAGDIQKFGLPNVLDVWSARDPLAAERYVTAMPPGPAQDSAAGHLALALGARKPDLLFDWADQLPTESARNAALVGIASSWARTDPASATKWAFSFPSDSPIREEAIRSALSYWALQDAPAASAFVPKLSDAEQPAAIMTVAPALAQADTSAALAWAQALPNEDIRAIALDAVVDRWADRQPQAAATWLMKQPENAQRVDRARTVTERWFARDPNRAIAWAQSLPPGSTRDGAIDMAAAQLAGHDPVQATTLATSIGDPALRRARLEQLRPTGR